MTYLILATVLVLGIIWELIYHVIQQFRWEKDWPTLVRPDHGDQRGCAGLAALRQRPDPRDAAGLDDGNLPSETFWAFFIDFSVIWFVIWIWTNGPMRVPLIRWRFFGGRIV